jgi:uncharacterized protein (TIGR00369 family)
MRVGEDKPLESRITEAHARSVIAHAPFARWWGLTLERIAAGSATVSLPDAPHLRRREGILHGAAYDLVADVGMWLAIMTRTGTAQTFVTVELKTNFLRSTALGIASTAKLVHFGRRIAFGTAETFDSDGRHVAHTSLTYARASDAITEP